MKSSPLQVGASPFYVSCQWLVFAVPSEGSPVKCCCLNLLFFSSHFHRTIQVSISTLSFPPGAGCPEQDYTAKEEKQLRWMHGWIHCIMGYRTTIEVSFSSPIASAFEHLPKMHLPFPSLSTLRLLAQASRALLFHIRLTVRPSGPHHRKTYSLLCTHLSWPQKRSQT